MKQSPNCTLNSREYDPPEYGLLLQHGACIGRSYEKAIPGKSLGFIENTSKADVIDRGAQCWGDVWCTLPYTLVYTNINHQMVREIDDKKRTVTLDISLELFWMDNRIKTYKQMLMHEERSKLGEIGLPLDRINQIWTPDLHIYNVSDYKSVMESVNHISLKVLTTHHLDNGLCLKGPMVRYEVDIKITFYCEFDYSVYPMDHSTCQLRLGSRRSDMKLILRDKINPEFNDELYHAVDFEVKASIVGQNNLGNETQSIGLDIKLTRAMRPFMMKYYLPCITIIILSQCSFAIPITGLPGRVGLIATQFFTLTSIFLQQMVIFKIL